MALDLVDEPDEVQLQEATLRPLQLAQGPSPCRSSAIAVRARARAAALQRKVSQEPGGDTGDSKAPQQGTALRGAVLQYLRKKSRAGLVTASRDGPGW